MACCRRLLRILPHRREDGCDVPSRAARDADHGWRATGARAHGAGAGGTRGSSPSRSGLLLGAGQLVRAWSFWMVAVATVVLVAAALGDRSVRRSALGATAVALVLAAIVPAPWYVHQATHYSNPVFDRPQEDEFLLARRPLAFYVDARFPDIIRQPWQGAFNDRFLPVFYAETWGDYFGIWSWGPGRADRTDEIDSSLARQSVARAPADGSCARRSVALLGLAMTRPREDSARLVAALPPVAASRPSCTSRSRIRRATATRSRGRTRLRPCRRSRCASASPSTCLRDLDRRHRPGVRARRIRTCRCSRSSSGERARDRRTAAGLSAAGLRSVPRSSCAAILAAQVLGGLVREMVSDEPSHLEMVRDCLTERSTPFEPVVGDSGCPERGARCVADDRRTETRHGRAGRIGEGRRARVRRVQAVGAADVTSRLERRRRVVFLWDAPPRGRNATS